MAIHAPDDQVPFLSDHLCTLFPKEVGDIASMDNRYTMKLGPEEWFVFDETAEDGDVFWDVIATKDPLFSAIDVTHRQTGMCVEGDKAENVLSTGYPSI